MAQKLTTDQKSHLLACLRKGIRYDGRSLEEYRPVQVEVGIIETAEGSARVKIGDTELLAGVKLAIEKPYPDIPDEGTMMVGAEFLPLSNPDFEMGPPSTEAIELARVVDRGIRESKAIDTKKLCLVVGEKVWIVQVDICIINDSGNLFDASSLAVLAALMNARFPTYENGKVDYKALTTEHLPLLKYPIEVTVYKLGDQLFVDPTIEEQGAYDARLTVAALENGKLCALQKGGDNPLQPEEIIAMVELAMKKAKELRPLIKNLETQ